MVNVIHQLALDSEEMAYCGDGIWIHSNPFFGLLFKDTYGDFVFNKALCMSGVL